MTTKQLSYDQIVQVIAEQVVQQQGQPGADPIDKLVSDVINTLMTKPEFKAVLKQSRQGLSPLSPAESSSRLANAIKNKLMAAMKSAPQTEVPAAQPAQAAAQAGQPAVSRDAGTVAPPRRAGADKATVAPGAKPARPQAMIRSYEELEQFASTKAGLGAILKLHEQEPTVFPKETVVAMVNGDKAALQHFVDQAKQASMGTDKYRAQTMANALIGLESYGVRGFTREFTSNFINFLKKKGLMEQASPTARTMPGSLVAKPKQQPQLQQQPAAQGTLNVSVIDGLVNQVMRSLMAMPEFKKYLDKAASSISPLASNQVELVTTNAVKKAVKSALASVRGQAQKTKPAANSMEDLERLGVGGLVLLQSKMPDKFGPKDLVALYNGNPAVAEKLLNVGEEALQTSNRYDLSAVVNAMIAMNRTGSHDFFQQFEQFISKAKTANKASGGKLLESETRTQSPIRLEVVLFT